LLIKPSGSPLQDDDWGLNAPSRERSPILIYPYLKTQSQVTFPKIALRGYVKNLKCRRNRPYQTLYHSVKEGAKTLASPNCGVWE